MDTARRRVGWHGQVHGDIVGRQSLISARGQCSREGGSTERVRELRWCVACPLYPQPLVGEEGTGECSGQGRSRHVLLLTRHRWAAPAEICFYASTMPRGRPGKGTLVLLYVMFEPLYSSAVDPSLLRAIISAVAGSGRRRFLVFTPARRGGGEVERYQSGIHPPAKNVAIAST